MKRPLLLTCALALAACSSSPTVTPTPNATPTDTIAASSPEPTTATAGPTSSPHPSPFTVQPSAESTSARPVIDPPRAGVYRYEQTGETRAGVFTIEPDPEGTLTVSEPNGARQKQEREYSSSQSIEQVLLYRRSGVYLAEYTSRFATQELECRLDEPILVVELPLAVGNSWNDTGSCNGLDMRVRGTAVATERRTVGGAAVNTFQLKMTIEVTGDGLEQTTNQRVWISPKYRLVVRAVERSHGTVEGQEFTSKRTDDLISLQPS